MSVSAADAVPELPAWKAFVVQFTQASGSGDCFAGRVEHLTSGHRVRFASRQDLLEALGRQLEELEKTSR